MEQFEIGTDIQRVRDFEDSSAVFLNHIFTVEEILYCKKKRSPAQHFAARFAAKESIIKAFSQYDEKIDYKKIEVLIKDKKPVIKVHKSLKSEYTIKISLSHSADYSIAYAIVLKHG